MSRVCAGMERKQRVSVIVLFVDVFHTGGRTPSSLTVQETNQFLAIVTPVICPHMPLGGEEGGAWVWTITQCLVRTRDVMSLKEFSLMRWTVISVPKNVEAKRKGNIVLYPCYFTYFAIFSCLEGARQRMLLLLSGEMSLVVLVLSTAKSKST